MFISISRTFLSQQDGGTGINKLTHSHECTGKYTNVNNGILGTMK